MNRGLLLFGAATVVAWLLIKLARRALAPKAAMGATGGILAGACFAASVLSFTTPLSRFDWFGVSAIALGLGISWILGERRLAADSRTSGEASVVVFKLSGDEEADLRRSVEIMTGLAERLRARGLECSEARPLKPWGAGVECASFYAALNFGPSPGTLAIELRSKGPSMDECRRLLGDALAAEGQTWMTPAERHRLARESS